PEVGASGKQQRTRIFLYCGKELVERARPQEHLIGDAIVAADRQRQNLSGSGATLRSAINRIPCHPPASLDNRAIASAAGKVSGKRFMNERVVRRLRAMLEREHGHDESRCAEPALRCMGLDQRLLHGMQAVIFGTQALNSYDGAAIDLRQHHQAGIHRLILQFALVAPAKHNGAGTTVALGATLLRSGEPRAQAKPIEHRHGRRRGFLAAQLPIQQELQRRHQRFPSSKLSTPIISLLARKSPHIISAITPMWLLASMRGCGNIARHPTKRRVVPIFSCKLSGEAMHLKLRRNMAAVIGIVLLCAGSPVQQAIAQTSEKVTVRFTWKFKGEYAPLFVALDKGYYKAEGLDVELAEGTGAQTVLKLLAGGNEKFGYGPAFSAATAISQGLPVKVIALYQTKAPMGVISFPDTVLKSPKDLEGKRLAIAVGETFSDMLAP